MRPQQLRDGDYSSDLLGWLMPKIKEWRQYRDDNYKEKWDEYYRLWRGIFDAKDKLRDSERSRLISPALQQAVEGGIAEMEEATFGRDLWFDLIDDSQDTTPGDMEKYRVQLKEDLEKEKIRKRICEAMLNGGLYGTGIGEIITEEKEELYPDEKPIQGTPIKVRGSSTRKYLCVRLNPVSPYNFSSDPGIADIDDGLGCEATEIVSEHLIEEGIKSGAYDDVDFGSYSQDGKTFVLPGETRRIPTDGKVKLTRYYGKVPTRYLTKGVTSTASDDSEDDEALIEAIVIIANDNVVLKSKKNPYIMQDRPIVAYQHDTVPGRFWGRGICEKGYNPQKALDTELRARADNLALTTHPMMGVDASRLPRGMKPKVQPGLTIMTNGDPKSILMPFNFGNLNPVSYKESAELERMVTMGTGTMDSAAPMGVNPRNSTLGGMSMMQAASIKRQKRTLQNFQENFLAPFIKKSLWRFMQFDPEHYPVKDFKFQAVSTMGIMARELEMQNMVTLLGYVAETPAAPLILKGIVSNSSFQTRDDILAGIDKMQQQSQKQGPTPEQQTAQAQVQVQADNNKVQRERLAADTQKQQGEFAIKQKELALRSRELDIREKEIIANNAIKELGIRTTAQTDREGMHSKAATDRADISARWQTDRRDHAVKLAVAGNKEQPKPAAPKEPKVVVEFPTQKKTVTITTPSGKQYVGEIRSG